MLENNLYLQSSERKKIKMAVYIRFEVKVKIIITVPYNYKENVENL